MSGCATGQRRMEAEGTGCDARGAAQVLEVKASALEAANGALQMQAASATASAASLQQQVRAAGAAPPARMRAWPCVCAPLNTS